MESSYALPLGVDVAAPHLDVSLASRGARFVAVLLDGLVLSAMVYLPFFLGASLGAAPVGSSVDPAVMFLDGLGLAVIPFAIWCWLNIRYVRANGQSIGKKLAGIKVIRTDGRPATLGRIFWLRNVVNGLLCVIPFYGLVDILFIFGESQQCLHDRLADTRVINA